MLYAKTIKTIFCFCKNTNFAKNNKITLCKLMLKNDALWALASTTYPLKDAFMVLFKNLS